MRCIEDLNDQFWIDALTCKEQADEIICLFFSHKLEEDFLNQLPLMVLTKNQLFEIVLKVLAKTDCAEIIRLRKENFVPFQIDKSDICQFSDFDDCYFKCISIILDSGLQCVSWEKLGFMLRDKPRKQGADLKYGENHGKTAAQLGLLSMNSKREFLPSRLGLKFYALGKKQKEELMPKLCLYIPIIQNFFVLGQDENVLDGYFAILSESTQKRRRPNIKRLISIVSSCL